MECSRIWTIAKNTAWWIRNCKNSRYRFYEPLGIMDRKKVLLAFKDGTSAYVRIGDFDMRAISEIWIMDTYKLRDSELGEGDIIDIGGHKGFFALYAARLFGNKRIVSFEPLPENYTQFEQNMLTNKLSSRVKLIKAACGRGRGIALFDTSAGDAGGALSRSGATKVRVVNLEKSLGKTQRIALMKIDCEGGEYQILESTSRNFWDRVGLVAMEYHARDGYNGEWLEKFFLKRGFSVTRDEKHHMLFAKHEETAARARPKTKVPAAKL